MCLRSGVGAGRDNPEPFPRIECGAGPVASVVEVVGRVAGEVDEAFHFALRDDLK
jgi:hypothetical protein